MGIVPYLAMTAEEAANCPSLPQKIAFMACHYSSYGTGLQDLPDTLPEGALLILDDRIPVAGHHPEEIAGQLYAVTQLLACGLLLDLQRPGSDPIVDSILEKIPGAVVSEGYAKGRNCAVFLPPVPLLQPLSEYIAPWKSREVWLDAAVECVAVTITERGSSISPCMEDGAFPFEDRALHCHYRLELQEDCARFILCRTKEDVKALLEEAEALGVANAVGLYQQLI